MNVPLQTFQQFQCLVLIFLVLVQKRKSPEQLVCVVMKQDSDPGNNWCGPGGQFFYKNFASANMTSGLSAKSWNLQKKGSKKLTSDFWSDYYCTSDWKKTLNLFFQWQLSTEKSITTITSTKNKELKLKKTTVRSFSAHRSAYIASPGYWYTQVESLITQIKITFKYTYWKKNAT